MIRLLTRQVSWRRQHFLRMPFSSAPLESQSEASSCWSCFQRLERGSLACHGCSKLQPLSAHVDLYALLGLGTPHRYDIDLIKLEAQYKRLQWLVHPDLAATRSDEEKSHGAAAVTKINEAFSVLKSPLLRARYLLHERGVGLEAEEATTVADTAFLGEVMEAREAVEEAAGDVAALEGLLKDTRSRAGEVIRDLSREFDQESSSSSSVERARELTMKLTYLSRLEEEIRAKLPTSYE